MLVKVLGRRRGDAQLHETDPPPQCRHVAIGNICDEAGDVVGVRVTLCYKDPAEDVEIVLPRDGRVIYFENDSGDTVETIRWPQYRYQHKKLRDFRNSKERETWPSTASTATSRRTPEPSTSSGASR